MSLKMGIVGLPNIGKSTLFNAITNSKVLAENYPFATIEPNVGIVTVNDKRLVILEKIFKPKKVLPTTFEFIDIAGLIKGASTGEGLGNAFLASIREADAICQVVRCFKDDDVKHVEGGLDSVRDVEIINLELIISDQLSVSKQLSKIAKRVEHIKNPIERKKYLLLKTIQNYLKENKLLNQFKFTESDELIVKTFNLLTVKPFIYVANISEDDLLDKTKNDELIKLQNYAKLQNISVIELSAEFESQISNMDSESKLLFMKEYNLKSSGLEKLVLKSYKSLKLDTFFTAGPDEVRAWTFKSGSLAPDCAGVIHTDFKKGFIKAEIYSFDDLLKYKTERYVRENGKMRIEGKKYPMKDGDICFFRFNV